MAPSGQGSPPDEDLRVVLHQKRLPSLTDALLEAAITGVVREVGDAEVRRIRSIDHRIAMCEGEDTCLDPEVGRCTLGDDSEHVVDLAEGAQAMLLAMPVYAGNAPAVLKTSRNA